MTRNWNQLWNSESDKDTERAHRHVKQTCVHQIFACLVFCVLYLHVFTPTRCRVALLTSEESARWTLTLSYNFIKETTTLQEGAELKVNKGIMLSFMNPFNSFISGVCVCVCFLPYFQNRVCLNLIQSEAVSFMLELLQRAFINNRLEFPRHRAGDRNAGHWRAHAGFHAGGHFYRSPSVPMTSVIDWFS